MSRKLLAETRFLLQAMRFAVAALVATDCGAAEKVASSSSQQVEPAEFEKAAGMG